MTTTSAYIDKGALPYVNSHTREFLDNPNSLLGTGAERLVMARGLQGVEIYPYDVVRGLFHNRAAVPRDPEYFRKLGVPEDHPVMTYLVEGNLNLTWPENHDRLRPILTKGFTPGRIEAAKPMITEIAKGLLDRIEGLGRCDFVTDYSHHLSIGVISRFLGIPADDVPYFQDATVDQTLLGQIPLEPHLAQMEHSFGTVAEYSARLVALRRTSREPDFINEMIEAQESGDQLSEAQLVWSIAGMLLAGHDTTRYQLANAVRALVEAGQWDYLADHPQLVSAAVNEAMRLYPAVPRQVKILTTDLDIAGHLFPAGEIIVLSLAAAGRDPSAFHESDRFDLYRPDPWYDIGFGHGAHYCLGIALAKAEINAALTVLTRHLTEVELDGEIQVKAAGVICGPDSLPIRFRAR